MTKSYQYMFNGPGDMIDFLSVPMPWWRGSSHGAEIPYLFDVHWWAKVSKYNLTSNDIQLSNTMMTLWTNFAKTGLVIFYILMTSTSVVLVVGHSLHV